MKTVLEHSLYYHAQVKLAGGGGRFGSLFRLAQDRTGHIQVFAATDLCAVVDRNDSRLYIDVPCKPHNMIISSAFLRKFSIALA